MWVLKNIFQGFLGTILLKDFLDKNHIFSRKILKGLPGKTIVQEA